MVKEVEPICQILTKIFYQGILLYLIKMLKNTELSVDELSKDVAI